MYWEHVIGCTTMCSDCDQMSVSYLEDGVELLAHLFRSVDMKDTLMKPYYTAEAEKQKQVNEAGYEEDFDENEMLWFRDMVCGDCLKKGLIEETFASPKNLEEARSDYICGDVLVAYQGNPLVSFTDFVGGSQRALEQLADSIADRLLENLDKESLKKIAPELFEDLMSTKHYGIKKEQTRLLEKYADDVMPAFLQLIYKTLEKTNEYKHIKKEREKSYRATAKQIEKYADDLVGYFEEEDLSEVEIGYPFENEFRSLGVHTAYGIDNPDHVHFFSGPYKIDIPQIKSIIREQPELIFECNEYSINRFHHQLLRKLQGMGIWGT